MYPLLPASCPVFFGPCGHAILEHIAWENGWEAGLDGQEAEPCPFPGLLANAWLCGHGAAYAGAYDAPGCKNGGQDVL